MENIELETLWEGLYNQCAESVNDYPYSHCEGFEELFLYYLRNALFNKQKTRKPISLTEASKITDNCAQHAIDELRSRYHERNDTNMIVSELRSGDVLLIPGQEKVKMGAYRGYQRSVKIVVSVKTFNLSAHEIESLINIFGEQFCQYESKHFILTIEANSLPLEGAEPTPIEQIAIRKEAANVIPLMISFLQGEINADVNWQNTIKDLFNGIKKKVRELLPEHMASNSHNLKTGGFDSDALSEILKDEL